MTNKTKTEAAALKPGTPLPWQYRDDYTSEGFVTIIGNVDGEHVDGQASCTYDVVCRCEDEFGERLPNVAQNVRYIVEACNAYPDLLALVERLVGALEVCDEELYAPDTGCSCHIAPPCKSCVQYGSIREAKDAARAALTEATAMLAERAKS